MKYFKLFEEYDTLNETKYFMTKASKADEIFKLVDAGIKSDTFYKINLGDKIYLKEGGKRLTTIKGFSRYFWIVSNNKYYKELGDSISFEYDYKQYTVQKRYLKARTKEEYLYKWLNSIFDQYWSNQRQKQAYRAEAQAAGVPTYKDKDDVDPRIDFGFIAYFAKKYKVNLKKWWDAQSYTYNYGDFMDGVNAHPFKP